MFSKALFKQTAKANWIKWCAVTVATCIMLAIVIIVLGNLGINNIRDSLKQVFTQANQEAYLKDNAVDLYTLYVTTAETNDQMDTFAGMGYTMIENLLTNYDNEVANYELENGVVPDENAKKEIANNISTAFIETNGNMIKKFAPNTDLDELKGLLVNVLLAHDKNAELTGKDLLMEGYYLTVYENAYTIAISEGQTEESALNEADQARIHAGKIVEELAKIGVEVLDQTIFIKNLMIPAGVLGKHKPTETQMEDVNYGFWLAKEMGKLDVGQSVVIKDKMIMAVEAIEGTDVCIKRGAKLAKNNAVVVKVAKPKQDRRFDIPAIGMKTLRTMHHNNASLIAVEANQTIIVDQENVIKYADSHNIVIMAI